MIIDLTKSFKRESIWQKPAWFGPICTQVNWQIAPKEEIQKEENTNIFADLIAAAKRVELLERCKEYVRRREEYPQAEEL